MSNEAPKMILVVRKDLNMRKGKIASQCSHSSMKILLDLMEKRTNLDGSASWSLEINPKSALYQWLTGSFTKVCVSVDSEEELLALEASAKAAGIMTALICDNGYTEFHGVPTNTVLAIGPASPSTLYPITGHLKLL